MSVNLYKMGKERFNNLKWNEPEEVIDDIMSIILNTDGDICYCGRIVQSKGLKKHKQSKVHKDYLEVHGLDPEKDNI